MPKKIAPKKKIIVHATHETSVAFASELQGMLPMLDQAAAVLRGMALEHDRATETSVGSYHGAAKGLSDNN